jgi:serine/threonine protein kinase
MSPAKRSVPVLRLTPTTLRARRRLGKYRIVKRVADGGFATVYQALDTITGIPVALKIPHPSLITGESLSVFRREVRLTAKLDHPHILPVRDAGVIDGTFYVATPLGKGTLADRLNRRLAGATLVNYMRQMLAALAFAHRKGIMHCDVKPENFILFPENQLRLADFGIARFAQHTVRASGSGTVGYLAPEQALGKPSLRSDVFALGLVLYRMFAGQLPEWPFEWPLPGARRLSATVSPEFVKLLRRGPGGRSSQTLRRRRAHATGLRAAARQNPAPVPNPAPAPTTGVANRRRRLANAAFEGIPPGIRQGAGHPLRLRALRWSGERSDAGVSVVRSPALPAHRRDAFSPALSALPPRGQIRLAILPLVLRSGDQRKHNRALYRYSIPCPVPAAGVLRPAANALDAVLSVVSGEGSPALDDSGLEPALSQLRMGRGQGFLGVLPLV